MYENSTPLDPVGSFEFYISEPLPGVLGNTGTVAFIFREQGIFSNYFQGTGELLTRLLGSFLGTRGFSNGEQGIKSKKVKGSWEHAPPPGRGSLVVFIQAARLSFRPLTTPSRKLNHDVFE